MAGSWPASQINAERKRIIDGVAKRKSDATKVAPSNGLAVNRSLTLQSADVALMREIVRYAIESMKDVRAQEEKWERLDERPILVTLDTYIAEAADLLERIS